MKKPCQHTSIHIFGPFMVQTDHARFWGILLMNVDPRKAGQASSKGIRSNVPWWVSCYRLCASIVGICTHSFLLIHRYIFGRNSVIPAIKIWQIEISNPRSTMGNYACWYIDAGKRQTTTKLSGWHTHVRYRVHGYMQWDFCPIPTTVWSLWLYKIQSTPYISSFPFMMSRNKSGSWSHPMKDPSRD